MAVLLHITAQETYMLQRMLFVELQAAKKHGSHVDVF